jgi:hypothetical protein
MSQHVRCLRRAMLGRAHPQRLQGSVYALSPFSMDIPRGRNKAVVTGGFHCCHLQFQLKYLHRSSDVHILRSASFPFGWCRVTRLDMSSSHAKGLNAAAGDGAEPD